MIEKTIANVKPKKFIDKLIYVVAIVYPLTTIPQIYDIFVYKSAMSISLLTWVLYDLFTCIFLWYAIENKLKPMIVEYSMWIIVQSIVVVGVFLYR